MTSFGKRTLPWSGFAFSVFLSSFPIIDMFWQSTGGGPSDWWWRPAFFGFLPLCFFLVGNALSSSRIEVQKLRDEVEALRSKLP